MTDTTPSSADPAEGTSSIRDSTPVGRRVRAAAAAAVIVTAVLAGGAIRTGTDQAETVREGAVAGEGVEVVNAGVYLLSVSQIDTGKGSYVADMYLMLECGTPGCELGEWEFMNGRAIEANLLVDEDEYREWRVQAALNTDPDLRDYPFDVQELTVELEDTRRTTDEVVYIATTDLTGLDDEVRLAGWQLRDWSSETGVHTYNTWDTEYSKYVYTLTLERPLLSSVHRIIAGIGGYFWAPCPTCGTFFGGHEWNGDNSIPTDKPGYEPAVCSPECAVVTSDQQ